MKASRFHNRATPLRRSSIRRTDAALGITKSFLPRTAREIPHLAGAGVEHPALAAQVRAFRGTGFRGSEEPTGSARTPDQTQ